MLFDASARVGPVTNRWVREIDSESENYNGQVFRACLDACGLSAVSTVWKAGHAWTLSLGTVPQD
eukprot:6218342-Pyramimonas_sp.AAC.1